MKISLPGKTQRERGSAIVVYCIVLVTVIVAIGGLATLVSQTTRVSRSRSNMIAALQYAEGGAVIAASDLNAAVTKGSGTIPNNLTTASTPYTKNTSLSTGSQTVYQRTITAPFTNQSVIAQVWLPSGTSASSAKIVVSATVGQVTQTATANVKVAWGYPGAIISVNAGTSSTSVSKTEAQAGNVVINGDKSGPIVVDGGPGEAVIANGRVNYDTNYANPPASAYSQTNWGTANQIPDYTGQGTSNTLFDIGRFVAVADLTPSGPSPSHNNHFTNFSNFITAAHANTNSANALQGVVVVDVSQSDKNTGGLTASALPNGINVKGTLLFNFVGPGWDPTTAKFIVTADVNVNAANLSGLVAGNPATYPTGYPPTYSDNTHNPTNINITSKGYTNFMAGDDLPAMVYSIGVVDLHGGLNISGVMYTPSYMEIENKQSGQIQYMKGSLIMGNGIYYENTSSGAISIISFDPNTLDSLSTVGSSGKAVFMSYWQ
jgi:hypothetical protein